MKTAATLAAVTLAFAAGAVRADYSAHPRAAELISILQTQHAFSAEDLAMVRTALGEAQQNPRLIRKEQTAKEHTTTWTEYRGLHVTPRNVANGVRFLADNKAWLERAEREYGVPPAVVAAILGVETKYGTYTGEHRVLDSLATQGFDHPTRTPFFFSELVSFFVFCRDFDKEPASLKGSYAGAMGAAQFMPSNYRRLAVDFDGDGRINLWSLPDAIGSIGNYLVRYDPTAAWRRGEALIAPARVSPELQPSALVTNGKKPVSTARDLAALGLSATTPLPDDTVLGVIDLALDGGAHEYWLGLHNFYSVMTYNPRTFYAMAVTHLAAEISTAAAPPPAPAPTAADAGDAAAR